MYVGYLKLNLQEIKQLLLKHLFISNNNPIWNHMDIQLTFIFNLQMSYFY